MEKNELFALCNFIAKETNTDIELLWNEDALTKVGSLVVLFSMTSLIYKFFDLYRKEFRYGLFKEDEKV